MAALPFTLACLLAILVTTSLALLEEQIVTFQPQSGAIPIQNAAILYDSQDPVAIEIATESLANDFENITGIRPRRLAVEANGSARLGSAKTAIIAATVDSGLVRDLENRGLLNVTDIRGEWETFRTTVVTDYQGGKDALVIAGSDKRAVVYGIYTLAEQCGQSPYHYWADVSPTQHPAIYALPKTTRQGPPSVKYRGLFINDEAPALTSWWSKKHGVDHYPLDAEFYRHVFDLILRLKGNFIWPAMWASYVPRPGNIFFTDDPHNQQLADDYGIVVSTSHHEPMQRATNEWNSSETGEWDWTVNKANVTRFMREGVRRAGKNETYFTLGMRGPSDSAISAPNPIALLEDVFETERDMLAEEYGSLSAVNQVWTIYKEVATYYAGGLIPPEDVTLMFTDDNWGNIMRLPSAEEAARPGGIGLYYHFEYVGRPKSYKWQNTNNLAKVYKELSQALDRGADRIWVFNVADIKPMELPFAFAMDLAWNSSRFDFATIPHYLRAFVSRELGCKDKEAEEIASILLRHGELIGRRKYEGITSATYSFYHYHEVERVLQEWEDLGARVTNACAFISPASQAAFMHLVQYPVQAGLIYHRIVLGQTINQQFAIQRRNTANTVAEQILAASEADADLREEFHAMIDGKWDGIMDQPKLEQWQWETWLYPSRDIIQNLSFVQPRQDFVYNLGNLGIYAEGSQSAAMQSYVCESCDQTAPTVGSRAPTLPTMDPYGPATYTVDFFHRGDHRKPISFNLSVPYEWINISLASGKLSQETPEERLTVSIDWPKVPKGFNETVLIDIHYDAQPHFENLHIPILNRPALPAGFHGFPAINGYVSIEAAHFQRANSGSGTVSFHSLPHLGTRTKSGAVALRPYKAARASTSAAQNARVEYDIFLFEGSQNLTATLFLTQNLDTDPALPMQYSLAIDSSEGSFTRLLHEPETPGDLPDIWTDQVEDGVWTVQVQLGPVSAGRHTLTWRVNSPEVYLEKIVLDTTGAVRKSYLGPPETMMV
ncbi:hypothetical protein BDW72DRAFT_197774 [Aspergillus terricola var. indicus]